MDSLLSPTSPDPIWRFTMDLYHAMIEAGILPSGSPVELVEGILLEKMSKKAPHRIATRATRRGLEAVIPDGWFVDEQEPITLTGSEPEPDLMVARGDSADYPDSHPKAADVALVVEISDTTLAPAYWIVDLNESRVEVRTDPGEDGYRMVTFCSRNDGIPVTNRGRASGSGARFQNSSARRRLGRALGRLESPPGQVSHRDGID